ncbi:MAG: DUF4395 domain-containing protein [Thermoplasmatota archaeon]
MSPAATASATRRPEPGQIDPRAPRFNQGVVGVISLLAFVTNFALLLPLLAVFLGIGAFFGPTVNPLAQLWRRAVVPGFKLGPPKKWKDAAPARFAQGVGFVFLAAASAFTLATSLVIVGWILALLVAALALLAAITDICVGCEIYTLLARFRTAKSAKA